MHASLEFAYEFPEHFKRWHESSNSIVVLAVKDEAALKEQYTRFVAAGRCVSKFLEPDIGNEVTSICIEPHEDNKKMLSCFPLAGKVKNESGITRENYSSKTRVV